MFQQTEVFLLNSPLDTTTDSSVLVSTVLGAREIAASPGRRAKSNEIEHFYPDQRIKGRYLVFQFDVPGTSAIDPDAKVKIYEIYLDFADERKQRKIIKIKT